MHFIYYNRQAAVEYAERWAFKRNEKYYNFDGIGGDCTNFASQCLFAGTGVMNYEKDVGWYYVSPDDRAAAWTEANYFRRFMVNNTGVGPFGNSAPIESLEEGDFINLHNGTLFYHTLIVVGFSNGEPLVAAHTNDAYMRPLSTYHYDSARGLHILGANKSGVFPSPS